MAGTTLTKIGQILDERLSNRYQKFKSHEDNPLLQAEITFAKYLNRKYCLGVNSGGMAMTLVLAFLKRTLKMSSDSVVFTNSFTFNAVPSSIVVAGLKPVLVETTPSLVLDLEDLEAKIQAHPSPNPVLLLSYMRGRIPDMDAVMKLCERHNVTLVEDAAHAYGCQWRGRKIGSFGIASTMSTQANKVVHSGEGGFIATDSADLQAFCIVSSGCYESYFTKHGEMCPPREVYEKYKYTTPNWSVRMTEIQGQLCLEQILDLDATVATINKSYDMLKNCLKNDRIEFIEQLPQVSPVVDSLQCKVHCSPEELTTFVKLVQEKGYKIAKFLNKDNARYYKSWQFDDSFAKADLSKTDAALEGVCDMRIKPEWDAAEMQRVASVLTEALTEATSGQMRLE